MMKALVIVLSGVGTGRWWGHLTNVQSKAIQNRHNQSSLYNEYMLIKMKNKNKRGPKEF
jgi:hypothetical protein